MLLDQRRWLRVLFSALISSCLMPCSSRADWPQFRGPTGMGVSAEKGAPLTWDTRKNVVWKAKLPAVGTSSPIVKGNHIFLTGFSGYNVPGQAPGSMDQLRLHVFCLDKQTGELKWQKGVEPKLPEQARMREGHGYASATPAADAENVYAFFGKSGVIAFTHDGKQLWRADVGSQVSKANWGSAASPIVVGSLVIVNACIESESLLALDKQTGKEVWSALDIRESWNTPVLIDAMEKKELVVAIHDKLLAFEPMTGAPLWSCKTGIESYMVPSVAAHDGIIGCLGGRPGFSAAVRAGGKGEVTASHRLWKASKGSNVSSPIAHDGHLYWVNDARGIAFCADLKTGSIQYEVELPRASEVFASPVLADGRIYYLGRDGRTFVLAAKPAFELLATNSLSERGLVFNASPAVDAGRFYIRVNEWLYCLGER